MNRESGLGACFRNINFSVRAEFTIDTASRYWCRRSCRKPGIGIDDVFAILSGKSRDGRLFRWRLFAPAGSGVAPGPVDSRSGRLGIEPQILPRKRVTASTPTLDGGSTRDILNPTVAFRATTRFGTAPTRIRSTTFSVLLSTTTVVSSPAAAI